MLFFLRLPFCCSAHVHSTHALRDRTHAVTTAATCRLPVMLKAEGEGGAPQWAADPPSRWLSPLGQPSDISISKTPARCIPRVGDGSFICPSTPKPQELTPRCSLFLFPLHVKITTKHYLAFVSSCFSYSHSLLSDLPASSAAFLQFIFLP